MAKKPKKAEKGCCPVYEEVRALVDRLLMEKY